MDVCVCLCNFCRLNNMILAMDKAIIEKLRIDLSARLGNTIESPSDFNRLTLEIEHLTGETISVSTIKRVFGYIDSNSNPSTSTLSALARYLGYRGWADYCERVTGDSDFLNGYTVKSADIGGRQPCAPGVAARPPLCGALHRAGAFRDGGGGEREAEGWRHVYSTAVLAQESGLFHRRVPRG